jgi:hypothetical protein
MRRRKNVHLSLLSMLQMTPLMTATTDPAMLLRQRPSSSSSTRILAVVSR